MYVTLDDYLVEFSRFVPSVDAIIYHGDKKERAEIIRKHMPRTIGPRFPIVITSYEIALSDAKRVLRHYSWKYLVVDEVCTTCAIMFSLIRCNFLKFKSWPCAIVTLIKDIILLEGTPVEELKV